MDILECIRTVTYKYMKNQYENYLLDNNVKTLKKNEIISVVNEMYNNDTKKNEAIDYIKTEVLDIYNNNAEEIDEEELDEILEEIIDDKELLINRVVIEIENYQNSKN